VIAKAPSESPLSSRAAWLEVLIWAAYLACSWTWCIGMFLPVLLVRDYGVIGWIVFAIPNVIGAAAMGWVLRDGLSERVVRTHSSAIEWFRLVTVVFQLFFLLAYLAPPLQGGGLIGVQIDRSIVIAALGLGLALGLGPRFAILAWAISISCAAIVLITHDPAPAPLPEPEQPAGGILWLAPVCAFGFALCPYLDPTFHAARQSFRGSSARWAFSLGFGVLFLTLIAFTLRYAPWLISAPFGGPGPGTVVLSAIAVHMGLQLAYTCTVHARVNIGQGRWSASRLAFAMILSGIASLAAAYLPSYAGLEAREVVYRSFMAFYGLVFPAYVWLCMIPLGGDPASQSEPHSRRLSRAFRVCLITIGLAAPFYWMGFIERQELWLAPGLGIVLLSRLFVRPRPAPAAPSRS
jgi:hypothetical protein